MWLDLGGLKRRKVRLNIMELKQRRRRQQRERQQKTPRSLDKQNNNSDHAFFVHFLAFVARLRRESA